MDVERLVDDYINAWNRHDITQLLKLMDKRATFYDAFWMEYCVGRDLARYLQDDFAETNFWYKRTGNAIRVDNSVVFRYIAHERIGAEIGHAVFNGAEVLIFRDDKIVAVSDFYCNPEPSALEEVAKLAAWRPAETHNVQAGLGALKASRIRSLLSDTMTQNQVYLDAGLTRLQVAKQIGCSVDHLMQVINAEYGTGFENFLDQCRVKHATELLLKDSDDPNYVFRVALQSGFESSEKFTSSFRRLVGETPVDFRTRNAKKINAISDQITN